jgi:hypothetical protein
MHFREHLWTTLSTYVRSECRYNRKDINTRSSLAPLLPYTSHRSYMDWDDSDRFLGTTQSKHSKRQFFWMLCICDEKCSKPKIFLAFLSKLLCFSFIL